MYEFNIFLHSAYDVLSLEESIEMDNYLNEAYYGKSKILLKCEELFGIIHNKAYRFSFKNLSNLEESKQIEDLLCKQFNFKSVKIAYTESPSLGVSSVPMQLISVRNNPDFYKLNQDKSGISFRDNERKELLLFINYGTITTLNPAQTMAMVMEEIGHNFYLEKYLLSGYRARYICLSILRRGIALLNAFTTSLFTPAGIVEICTQLAMLIMDIFFITNRKAAFNVTKFLTSNVILQNISKIGENLSRVKFLNIVGRFLATLFNVVLLSPMVIVSWFSTSIITICNQLVDSALDKVMEDGYNSDRYSDNFAISYGYGPEIAQMHSDPAIIDRTRMKFDRIPIINFLSEVDIELARALSNLGNSKMHDMERIEMTEAKLKHELYNNKQFLTKDQIKNIENEIELITKAKEAMPEFRKNIYEVFSCMRFSNMWDSYSDKQIFDPEKTIIKDKFEEY